MRDKQFAWQSSSLEHQQETFFRRVDPEDYTTLGIDPQDVPMGTFASEDHPSFLPSRFGGNAYGLGLIEQSVLTRADTDFLESLDFQDIHVLGQHAKKLNAIYQKLGLLIRFSRTGKRYFLIPINLVAHSLQEVKAKADEIEELIIRHMRDTQTERLDIGLLTVGHDLIAHELTARLSNHRIFLFESLDKLRSWRIPLDIVLLPKDIFEYLLEQQLPKITKRSVGRKRLFQYAMYLAGKIYDLLDPTGKIIALAHSPGPEEDQTFPVRFKSEEDLKSFLLFSHIFKTQNKYEGDPAQGRMEVNVSDLHYYLNRFAFFEPHLKRLLDHQKAEELSIDAINELPHLNLRLPETYIKNPEKQWKWVFDHYFITNQLERKSPKHRHHYWQDRLEIDRELPESLFVFVGQPRQPEVALAAIEEEIKASGMQGCSLSLVAEYRNTFRYVLDVLNIIIQIRDHDFPKLSELERTRLNNPFKSRNESFSAIVRLLGQIPKLEKIRDILNPDFIEGQATAVLENIPKLSFHGFSPAQLREIVLIVVGHTTMTRIVFGKIPAKTLKPITDKAKEGNYQEILDVLRVCRLMSMAEIAAALGDSFTGEQARELYRLYDDAIYVATDPMLNWEKLHDLRISALGGVQNKAIREMMKLTNLFEFLDNWHEFIEKGSYQKEVFCDYQAERLCHLEEALELARIARHFKQQFMGDYIFGQSYFFRQFLEDEFHGTGHLFPQLGGRAAFILLWVSVNSAGHYIINFNPMLAGITEDRLNQRVSKIKESLLRIPIDKLQPGFFEEIKKTLAEDKPAFIFDSGIRIISDPETRVMDFSYVDVDENIQQIEVLLSYFESHKLRGISLKNLQELERLFSELESFHSYLHREGCYLQCDIYNRPGGIEAKDRDIGEIQLRLKLILQSQIFIPEEIYDNISVLAKHCPEILRFILPEFHAFGSIVENLPTRQPQSLGMYVMACLEKFQALIMKDRNSFQDRNTFYQLAKQEFGPLAEEGIGASHAQLDILEFIVNRIQQRPVLYQSLTFALLFQDIGKIDEYVKAFPEVDDCWTHAEKGAIILERSTVLDQYQLDDLVERLVVYLVRHHGLFGHVIRGEEPLTALERITEEQDDRLLDVFVLHSILAASAVQEGLMISDLLDGFLAYRAVALQIIKSKSNWETWLREIFKEKGEAVLTEFQLSSHDTQVIPYEQMSYCGFEDQDIEDDALWHGRQSAALERLLKLMGATWVDYQDMQMLLCQIPVTFIYHKKKLKSVGLEVFEAQLRMAMKLLDIISSLSPETRYYLLYCMDHLGGAMRIYDFHSIPRFLDPEECIKLLLIAFQTFHEQYGARARNGLISFRRLSQNVQRRHEALQSMLRELPLPVSCFDGGHPKRAAQGYGRLHFQTSGCEQAILVDHQDAIQFDRMVQALADLWDHEKLGNHYESLLQELQQKLPYDTKDLEEELRKAFEEQRKRINDHVLKGFQTRLGEAEDFAQLQQIQESIPAKQSEVNFTEDQQFLLKEMFEFHRSRLRDRYLDSIYLEINAVESEDGLSRYWNKLKYELLSYRSYVGKEYELLIAQFIDQKLNEMEGERGIVG